MKKWMCLVAAASSALTLLAVWGLSFATVPSTVKLENARVRIFEVIYAPGVPRERYIRPTDQAIVFLDDCRYERTDSQTKEKTIRERKAGEVIWHNKGEDAPVLINLGSKPYRTLVIELK
ncbi:MAG TPA: hypothetical protein VNY30_01950 [Bryobacteraceae bacterium]|nr:hypothetical protein [Bryobacteraceae bacterium]